MAFARIANGILDALAMNPLNGTQLRILIVIFRYTYGFNRKEAELSESYISKATGIDRRNIRREMAELINKKIVTVVKEAGFTNPRVVKFNKNHDQWGRVNLPPPGENIPEGEKATTPGGELAPSPEGELTPQERKYLKKYIKKDIVPFSEIKDLFNAICISLPSIQKLTNSRKDKVSKRWKEIPDIEQWKQLFRQVECTPFLLGKNDRGWKASFDWLLANDSNYTKVLESQYGNCQGQTDHKANEDYLRLKESLNNGSAGI